MRITFITRDSRTHVIRLASADCSLDMLLGFRGFTLLFQCCFAAEGGPWLPVSWVHGWFRRLDRQLEIERELLPYRYGTHGDFGGGETVRINGETWSLNLGAGECSISQAVHDSVADRRLVKWVDLRGQPQLGVDGGAIKLQRRKHAYRWYDELPGLLKFFESLPPEAEVRAARQAQ